MSARRKKYSALSSGQRRGPGVKPPDGGGGTGPGIVGTKIRPDLPFNLPTHTELTGASKKVFAHYFLTYPIALTSSQDSPTAPDVDTRVDDNENGINQPTDTSKQNQWNRWNPPSYGNYAAYGGEVRDRPLFMRAPRASITSPTLSTKTLDYRVLDKITEIKQAISAGIDGFTPDWLDVPVNDAEYDLSVSSANGGAPLMWRKLIELYEAVAEVRRQGFNFWLIPMPDSSTNGTSTVANVVNATVYLEKTYPGVHYKENGKMFFSPYYPEVAPKGTGTGTAPLTFWKDVKSGLLASTSKIDIHFIATYQRLWDATAQQPTFKDLPTQGISRWGDRSPATTRAENQYNRQMYARIKRDYPGNTYMAPVSFQDYRPNQQNYYESDHEDQLTASWDSAIDQAADIVQIPTWNDYAEGANIAPTLHHGWTFLDLSLWWTIKYKFGDFPRIERDAVYLTHRRQSIIQTVTYDQYKGSMVDVQNISATTFTLSNNDGTTAAITYSTTRSTMEANIEEAVKTLPGMSTATVSQEAGDASKYYIIHPTLFSPAAEELRASNGVTWKVEFMTKRSGGTDAKDEVSANVFLTATADVTIDVGGNQYTTTGLGVGYHVVRAPLFPIGTGLVSVSVIRNGTIVAAVSGTDSRKVQTTRPVQNVQYYGAKSLPNIDAEKITT